MQPPDSLLTLIDEGIIDEVLRPLMSGKEAQVYLVRTQDGLRVAKVYKEALKRSFKQKSDYTEGRGVRNSRDRRAMNKRTRYGREQDEAAWRSAEVDMMYRLSAAGVRVPTPYHFIEGVLVMELVCDADGNPAPRLGDLTLDPEGATQLFERVLTEVVRMLAVGVVHGDLSDFNVLVGADGPVIIDFPQSVEASSNQNARKLLLRDVDNLHHFIARFLPGRQPPPFAQEMWRLYERGELTAETKLKGRFRAASKAVSTDDVLALIADADDDERLRRQKRGLSPSGGPGAAKVGVQAQVAKPRGGQQNVLKPAGAKRPEPLPGSQQQRGGRSHGAQGKSQGRGGSSAGTSGTLPPPPAAQGHRRRAPAPPPPAAPQRPAPPGSKRRPQPEVLLRRQPPPQGVQAPPAESPAASAATGSETDPANAKRRRRRRRTQPANS